MTDIDHLKSTLVRSGLYSLSAQFRADIAMVIPQDTQPNRWLEVRVNENSKTNDLVQHLNQKGLGWKLAAVVDNLLIFI